MPGTTFTFDVFERITGPVKRIGDSFKKANAPLDRFRQKLNVTPKSIQKLENELAELNHKKRQSFSTKEIRIFNQQIAATERKIDQLNGGFGRIGSLGNRLKNSFSGVGGLMAGAFAVGGVTQFGGKVIDTISEFEKYEAVLTNLFGNSSMAKTVLNDITDFASKTPFQVNELTDSWVRMANQGFTPNMQQMTKLGDLASATGKDFTQLSEAILDAQTGEFERLKEFGIKASKSGNKVSFTFKGVKKEVDFTSDSIQKYLLGLGDLNGVQGASAAIMGTTGGRLSNLSDKWTQLQKTVGELFLPVIIWAINSLGVFVERLKVAVSWIGENKAMIKGWAVSIGTVVGGFLALWGAAKLFLAIKGMIATVTVAWSLFNGALGISKIAMIAFNIVASLNPIGMIVIAIGLAIGALVALATNFGGFRDFMIGLAKMFWKFHPFSWITNLVEKVFPNFFSNVKSVFGKIWNWLKTNLIEPLTSWFSGIGDFLGFGEIKMPSIADVNSSSESSTGSLLNDSDPYSVLTKGVDSSSTGNQKGTSKKPIGSKIDTMVSGVSGNIKNININIEKQVETMVFKTQNLAMSEMQVRSFMTRLITNAVNDVNF